MGIIREQIRQIYHFLVLLIFLFGLNIVFNLQYDWSGVTAIVRSYIFVLSFYCVFIFSQLDYDEYIGEYKERFGRFARYRLFFDMRLFPFVFAILLNVIFQIINSGGRSFDVSGQMLKVLDGRYSNMIFYSLILFFVLRQNRRPGVAIPVFILGSVLFFVVDRFLHEVIPYGRGIGLVKLFKYMIFVFVLVNDFARSRFRIIKSLFLSVAAAIFLFMSVAGAYYSVYLLAGEKSQAGSTSLRMLLKAGFISRLPGLEHQVIIRKDTRDIEDLILYAETYRYNIGFDRSRWEEILVKQNMSTADNIFHYLNDKGMLLDFNLLSAYADKQSSVNKDEFLASENFKKYFSGYFREHNEEFIAMFASGNDAMKVWIIDCLAYADNPDSITFLIRFLTSVDREISRHAYSALKSITDTDPARKFRKDIYDLDVVNTFIEYRDKRIRLKR